MQASMNVSVDKQVMSRVFARASKVIERRNTLPILGMIQIEAKRNQLTVAATDLDVAYSTAVSGKCRGKTRLLLDRADVTRIFKAAPASHIDLCAKDGVVHASGEGFSAVIESVATDDCLPQVIDHNDVQVGPEFIVEAKALRTALDDVRHAISTEETRYYLNGVFLAPKGGRNLEAVATDGHRLMLSPLPFRYPPKGSRAKVLKDGGVIVPHKTIDLLLAFAPEGEDPVSVTLWKRGAQDGGRPSRIRFSWFGEKIETKLIDGTYPDYPRVVPEVDSSESKYSRLSVDVAKIAKALETCTTLAGGNMPHVRLALGGNGLMLDLYENGKARASTSVDAITGGALKCSIAFNANYLADALKRFSGSVDIWILDAASPVVMRAGELKVPDRRTVLMPVRV